jgi:hypothetical protein
MGRPKPKYFATTELVLELGLTFYMFAKLQKLGVIRSPDAYQGADRPLWLSETVKDSCRLAAKSCRSAAVKDRKNEVFLG